MAMLSLLQSGRRQQLHLNEMADLDSLVFGINSLHVDTRSESDDNINSDDEDSGSDAGTVLGIIISFFSWIGDTKSTSDEQHRQRKSLSLFVNHELFTYTDLRTHYVEVVMWCQIVYLLH